MVDDGVLVVFKLMCKTDETTIILATKDMPQKIHELHTHISYNIERSFPLNYADIYSASLTLFQSYLVDILFNERIYHHRNLGRLCLRNPN